MSGLYKKYSIVSFVIPGVNSRARWVGSVTPQVDWIRTSSPKRTTLAARRRCRGNCTIGKKNPPNHRSPVLISTGTGSHPTSGLAAPSTSPTTQWQLHLTVKSTDTHRDLRSQRGPTKLSIGARVLLWELLNRRHTHVTYPQWVATTQLCINPTPT